MVGKTRRQGAKAQKARKTRRNRDAVTVEGLQASFEKIDARARKAAEHGATDSAMADTIQRAWSEQFHADLSWPAIQGMIKHYRATGVRKTRKAKGKSQKGGMAPLSWTMGQGTTDYTYGRFPVEMGTTPQVVASLDRFYENPVARTCDTTGGHPAPGQAGGGFFDALLNGHAPMTVPVNAVQATVSTLQGAPQLNPSASPVAATVRVPAAAPLAFNSQQITPISNMSSIYAPF